MGERFDEARCLALNPFDGDFGGAGRNDGVLSDKIVTARSSGDCHTCAGSIVPSTRVRRRVEVYDGTFMRFSWCTECCTAMALAHDGAKDLDDRIRLGYQRRLAGVRSA